jgi:hypothetical protein
MQAPSGVSSRGARLHNFGAINAAQSTPMNLGPSIVGPDGPDIDLARRLHPIFLSGVEVEDVECVLGRAAWERVGEMTKILTKETEKPLLFLNTKKTSYPTISATSTNNPQTYHHDLRNHTRDDD